MPLIRKRRAATENEVNGDDGTPVPARRQRRRQTTESGSDDYADGDEDGDATQDTGNIDQMAKKLVRYALACESSRQPIRRADVGQKVLGSASRKFKPVFDEAQLQLQDVFGMQMVELPMREKVTAAQKRAAQRAEKQPTSSNSWILCSVLPQKYRDPAIIPPPQVPTAHAEASYIGLSSFIVALVFLSGGTLQESRLERHLQAVNAEQNTPIDRTERLLQRMVREGYLVRIKEEATMGADANVEYHVGPRGKVEMGEQGVAGMFRAVYGGGMDEDLERKLERTLKLNETAVPSAPERVVRRKQAQPRRARADTEGAEDEDEDEDSEDEDD